MTSHLGVGTCASANPAMGRKIKDERVSDGQEKKTTVFLGSKKNMSVRRAKMMVGITWAGAENQVLYKDEQWMDVKKPFRKCDRKQQHSQGPCTGSGRARFSGLRLRKDGYPSRDPGVKPVKSVGRDEGAGVSSPWADCDLRMTGTAFST